ncbi:hypothetical protein [Paenibacillus sp. N3.4]|uniref:hypothetical protein n=1 Tax=Paenibacillus sp. N3.4 TaxID=2603222 RepID=UPI0021C46F6B|nr:hypothetical protein [Paenibacillus sp. N3.4]
MGPILDLGVLARGNLHGIVLYNSEGEDLYAGILLAQEAGVKVTDFEGNPITRFSDVESVGGKRSGMDGDGRIGAPYLVAAVPEYHDELLKFVQEAIK